MQELRLDFPFAHAGLDETQQPVETGAGNFASAFDHLNFRLMLDHAQAVHDRREPLVAVQRVDRLAGFDKARVAGFDQRRGA